MKKLFLMIGLLVGLYLPVAKTQAIEPFITLTVVQTAALVSAGIVGVGKVLHDVGSNPRSTLGMGAAVAAGAGTGFVSLAFMEWLKARGCLLQGAGAWAVTIGILTAFGADSIIKQHLQHRYSDLIRLGSDIMHAGGYLAIASGLLLGAHMYGY